MWLLCVCCAAVWRHNIVQQCSTAAAVLSFVAGLWISGAADTGDGSAAAGGVMKTAACSCPRRTPERNRPTRRRAKHRTSFGCPRQARQERRGSAQPRRGLRKAHRPPPAHTSRKLLQCARERRRNDKHNGARAGTTLAGGDNLPPACRVFAMLFRSAHFWRVWLSLSSVFRRRCFCYCYCV